MEASGNEVVRGGGRVMQAIGTRRGSAFLLRFAFCEGEGACIARIIA
jgi:hypothetical protein